MEINQAFEDLKDLILNSPMSPEYKLQLVNALITYIKTL